MPETRLSAAVSATGTSLTVQDNAGLSNTDFIRLGALGIDKSEAVRINAAVTHGTALSTTAAIFAHPIGTEVSKILFDQWAVYGNTTNTTIGATLIATINVAWDEARTTYVNTGTEYAYYFVVPYNSYTTTASDTYSDGVSSSLGYADNTVGSLVEKALTASQSERGGRITDKWLLSEVNDCLRFLTGKLKRWDFLQVFDHALGSVTLGSHTWSLPADIEGGDDVGSILDVRIGTGVGLTYKDKKEFESEMFGVAHTAVTTQAVATDTTLEIDNSYDFADSGTVTVYISGTAYDITYTGVTRSATAGILTGIPASGDGSITVTIPVDTEVWQNPSLGLPRYFTVYEGLIKIWPPADASNDNNNIWLDYYSSKTSVDSYADAIESPRHDAVKHWLTAKMRALRRENGELNPNDPDWMMFREIVADSVIQELSRQGQKRKTMPKTWGNISG